MSKDTAILDYAKYIDNDNKSRYDILKSKGVNVKPNQNLTYYTDRMQQLKNADYDEPYVPDKIISQLEDEFNNDPMRTKNGGTYQYCAYYILIAKYDTCYIKRSLYNSVYITSDGQTFNRTNSNSFTINWDTSKLAGYLDDGTPIRWIKVYTNTSDSDTNSFILGIPTDDKTFAHTLFTLFYDISTKFNVSSGIMYSPINYLVLGENVNTFLINNMEFYVKKLKSLSPGIVFDFRYSCDMYIIELQANIIGYTTHNTGGSGIYWYFLKHIDFSQASSMALMESGSNPLDCPAAQSLLLPSQILKLSRINAEQLEIFNCPYILEDIDLELNLPACKLLTIPSDFKNTLRLYRCVNLTQSSLDNITNNLKDLSVDNISKTISFAKRLQYMFTEEMLNVITSKNWTVSFYAPY